MFLFSLLWFCGLAPTLVFGGSDYRENLDLTPLPPAELLASLNFQSNSSLDAFNRQSFRFFPRSLGQLLQHADTRELHLRFSTGRWDAERWGERPSHGFKEGATGVELWAWIEADSDEAAFAKWTTLTQSLSGLFCASLNFIDSTNTIRPVVTFEPKGNHSLANGPLHLLHGVLPGEAVCTENLTPFLKLLPCKGKAGISTLLDGHKLFDATWQTMSIDVQPICSEPLSCQIQIEQGVDMVLDTERSNRPRGDPIPRPIPAKDLICDSSKPYESPYNCYPAYHSLDKGWRLSDVFGHTIPGACPLAEDSTHPICIHVPRGRDVSLNIPSYDTIYPSDTSRCFSIPGNESFDIALPERNLGIHEMPMKPPSLHAERTTNGIGQERGGMRSILTNPSKTNPVEFVYLETLPWFIRPYLHTLRAQATRKGSGQVLDTSLSEFVKDVFYRPAIDRQRSTQLELILSIPPETTVTLVYDFEKAILRYTEYPPDANRGFIIAPAIIRVLSPNSHDDSVSAPVYLRTTNLLLPLPTPDFSMPYNVIIFTSTVMALAFGSIFNLLVRRFVAVEDTESAAKLKSRKQE